MSAPPLPSQHSSARAVRRPGKGSHVNVKMANGQVVTIPTGRGVLLKIGLLKAMLRKAEVSEERFVRLLQGGD